MKIQDLIRIVLSILLIICVWLDFKWALKVAITLSFIGSEMTTIIMNKIKKELT